MLRHQELIDLEKRNVAWREAGYLTVAEHQGNIGSAWLRFRPNLGNRRLKQWFGRHEFRSPIEPVIAVAGMVAECLYHKPVADVWHIMKCWNDGVILPSEQDCRYIPESPDVRTEIVERALSIIRLRNVWFDSIVTELMELEVYSG